MPRFAERLYCDKAHNGGWIFNGATKIHNTSANLALARNAQFDFSLNRVAAGAETYQVLWDGSGLRRIIESYQAEGAFQEQFNLGTPGVGSPPFTGISQFTTPTTAGPAKGIQIDNIVVVYQVGVVALTAASLAFAEAKYSNNVANVFTAIPIDATALPLLVQANPYVVTRAVTTPTMIVDDLSDLEIEFAFTMANTGTIRVYGIGVHCHFNFN